MATSDRNLVTRAEGRDFCPVCERACVTALNSQQEDELRETQLAAMRARVQEGIEQAERGELVDGEEAVARAKKRAASKRRHAGE